MQAFQARETTWVAYVLCQPAHSAWLYDGTAATKSSTLDRVSSSYPLYRSSDGVTWDELPEGSFVGSHPIQFIVYGAGEKSAVCP